jgi:excisionase family DNA binding protein
MRLMSRHEAAASLRISLRTLDRLVAAGALPVVRLGRRVVIREDDLENLVERRRVRHDATPKGADADAVVSETA